MTSGAQFILGWSLVVVLDVLLLGSCVFAIVKGRPAERFGGALYLGSALLDTVVGLATGQTSPQVQELMLDALVAFGYLALAIRYNNLWLGAVMMLKGAQLALHAVHMTDDSDMHIGMWNLYVLALDFVSLLISSTLILGTLASLRERRRQQQRPAMQGPFAGAPAA